MMKLSKKDMIELSVTIQAELVEGREDVEIAADLGLDSETYDSVKKLMLDRRAEELRQRPREHAYVEYCIDQKRNIKALDRLIVNLDSKSQYNALVGAIRLRSDIVDKIVQKGQEFGLIKKEAERREIVGGLIVAEMGPDDLRAAIVKNAEEFGEYAKKYGDTPLTELADAHDVYYGPAAVLTTGAPVDEEDDEDLVRAAARKIEFKKRGAKRSKAKTRRAAVSKQ